MCENTAKQAFSISLNKPRFAGAAPSANTGSKRRRLWDLPHECHCPVIGVCLSIDTLRQLLKKTLNGRLFGDDYEMHVGAVAECGYRNRIAEALQQELDRRYAMVIQRAKLAKTTSALADLWANAVAQGDVAGTFWAVLTHPRCDAAFQETLCRDMHMLQHQAGASTRVDISKYHALLDENAILSRELGRVQERCTRLLAEKTSELQLLNGQLQQSHIENLRKDKDILCLKTELMALKAQLPDLEDRLQLQYSLTRMSERQAILEQRIQDLRKQLAESTKAKECVFEPEKSALETTPARRVYPVTLHLQQKNVLCVGGRSGNVATYRELIERVGGRFAHHDGGVEDSHNLLDSSLAAADLVICQTGCISHNAYWRVKEFCKRTGKRCVFVENPSASSLERGLEQFSDLP